MRSLNHESYPFLSHPLHEVYTSTRSSVGSASSQIKFCWIYVSHTWIYVSHTIHGTGWSFMANLRKYTVLPMDASWVYGSFCLPQGAASHGRYVGLVRKAELRHRADADGEHDSQSKPHTTGTEHEAYHRCIVGRIFSCNSPPGICWFKITEPFHA